MRLPIEKIKQAILHPEAAVRLTALMYFAESHSADDSVMPVVIEAVEKYPPNAFEMLRHAERLPQRPATIDWLIDQLRRPYNTESLDEDNLRTALAMVLLGADPENLARRHKDILSAQTFPAELKGSLSDILKMEFRDWPTLWEMFEAIGQRTMRRGEATRAEHRRFHYLMRAMGRHRDQGAEPVLRLLRHQYKGYDQDLMVWLEPRLVELAGRMQLQEAVPLLLDRQGLDDEHEAVVDEVGTALVSIGGDAVIEAVARHWPKADEYSRITLCEPLDRIHSDLAVQVGLTLLSAEENEELRSGLAFAILSQFATESIEPVRRVLLENEDEGGDYWDLRYRLIATATIMGQTFPEYEQWHADAVASNYGEENIKGRIEPFRLADTFAVDEEKQPRSLRRIRPKTTTLYQLKVTLKDIRPPVWRRLLVLDCTLDDLHEIIQIAMGWESYHLYCFAIDAKEFTHPDMDEGELNMEDATSTMLSDVIHKEKQKCVYRYDFGDGWKHEVVVEKIMQPQTSQKYPLCVKGSRACPPEDVGGPWGYAEYLEALADPSHEHHEEFLGWRGKFASEAFDLEAVNRELRNVFRW